MKKKGITASDLKYIAILAMFIDHIGWLAIPTASPLGQIMHAIGRITAPVMCFFLSEGYHYTKNFKKYLLRMGIFAVISHFAFCFYKTESFFGKCNESMITTLFLCLVGLHVYNHEKIPAAWKLVSLLGIAMLTEYCDWGSKALLFTFAFELARGNRKQQLMAFSGVAFLLMIVPMIIALIKTGDLAVVSFYRFGVFLPVPLLMLYNGEKGGSKHTKWVFYIFYPAHLLLLGLLSVLYL